MRVYAFLGWVILLTKAELLSPPPYSLYGSVRALANRDGPVSPGRRGSHFRIQRIIALMAADSSPTGSVLHLASKTG